MLTDAQWSELAPLLEPCRSHSMILMHDLRRTIGTILWRHENGAKWRALPEEHGSWWVATQPFVRWARLGVWERMLALVQERGLRLGIVFLDGTTAHAHQKGRGRLQKGLTARNETCVKRLAGLVAVSAPRPA